MQQISSGLLILILGLISAITPFSIDIYIPSIPTIAKDFGVEISYIEFSLSIFLFGMCFGLVFGGIMSDKLGRKKTLLIGLSSFFVISLLLFFSTSLYQLLAFRFVQAIFGGMIVVNSSAIVRDLYSGKEMAKMFGLIGSISMLAPIVAPFVGSLILNFFSWHYIFLFLALYAMVVVYIIYFKLTETYTYKQVDIKASFLSVIKNKKAMYYIMTLAVSFGCLFIFITKSAFIYIDYYGVDTRYFPIFFGADVLFLVLIARYNIVFISRYKIESIIKFGIILQIVSACIFLLLSSDISLYTTFVLLTINVSMIGFIFGNINSLVLEYFPHNSGVASSVIGIINYATASIISFGIAFIHDNTLIPIALSMLIANLLAIYFMYKGEKI